MFFFFFQLNSRGMCIKIVVRLSVIKVDTDMQCGEIHLGFSTETCNRERWTGKLSHSFSLSLFPITLRAPIGQGRHYILKTISPYSCALTLVYTKTCPA